MQILRIILMVCFVFTVYPSIGEAQSDAVKLKTADDLPTSLPRLSVTTSTPSPPSPSLLNGITNTPTTPTTPTLSNGSPARTLGAPLDPSWKVEEGKSIGKVGGQETLSNGSPAKTLGVPLGKEGGYQPDTDMKDLLDVEDTSDPQDVPTRRRSTNPIK